MFGFALPSCTKVSPSSIIILACKEITASPCGKSDRESTGDFPQSSRLQPSKCVFRKFEQHSADGKSLELDASG